MSCGEENERKMLWKLDLLPPLVSCSLIVYLAFVMHYT